MILARPSGIQVVAALKYALPHGHMCTIYTIYINIDVCICTKHIFSEKVTLLVLHVLSSPTAAHLLSSSQPMLMMLNDGDGCSKPMHSIRLFRYFNRYIRKRYANYSIICVVVLVGNLVKSWNRFYCLFCGFPLVIQQTRS